MFILTAVLSLSALGSSPPGGEEEGRAIIQMVESDEGFETI
jgi:hypothetical protein